MSFVPTDLPFVVISPVSHYAIGVIAHGVQNEQTIYVAPADDVAAGRGIAWRKVADVDDDVTSFDLLKSKMYLLTHKGASRFAVTSIDLDKNQTASDGITIVPSSQVVIQQIAVAVFHAEVADAGSADADEHLHELRAAHREERHPRLACDRAGEERLARSRRPLEEHATP